MTSSIPGAGATNTLPFLRDDEHVHEHVVQLADGRSGIHVQACDDAGSAQIDQELLLIHELHEAHAGATPEIFHSQAGHGYIRELPATMIHGGGRRILIEDSPSTEERLGRTRARFDVEQLLRLVHENGWVLGVHQDAPLGLRADGSPVIIDLRGLHRSTSLSARLWDRRWIETVLVDADRTRIRSQLGGSDYPVPSSEIWLGEVNHAADPRAMGADLDLAEQEGVDDQFALEDSGRFEFPAASISPGDAGFAFTKGPSVNELDASELDASELDASELDASQFEAERWGSVEPQFDLGAIDREDAGDSSSDVGAADSFTVDFSGFSRSGFEQLQPSPLFGGSACSTEESADDSGDDSVPIAPAVGPEVSMPDRVDLWAGKIASSPSGRVIRPASLRITGRPGKGESSSNSGSRASRTLANEQGDERQSQGSERFDRERTSWWRQLVGKIPTPQPPRGVLSKPLVVGSALVAVVALLIVMWPHDDPRGSLATPSQQADAHQDPAASAADDSSTMLQPSAAADTPAGGDEGASGGPADDAAHGTARDSGAPSSGAHSSDRTVRGVRDAPVQSPRELIEEISVQRFEYVTGVSDEPVGAEGSAASQADAKSREAFASISISGGTPYVPSASLENFDRDHGTATISAEVVVPEHRQSNADGTDERVAAEERQLVSLELTWEQEQWRVQSVTALDNDAP